MLHGPRYDWQHLKIICNLFEREQDVEVPDDLENKSYTFVYTYAYSMIYSMTYAMV